MSIDEVIKTCKDITNYEEPCPGYCMRRTCDKCVQESEQLVEWLEELKELRATSCGYSKEDIELNRTAMYNKAIDDFADKLKSECREHYIDCEPYFGGITDSILYEDDIEEIAERLKVGGENV